MIRINNIKHISGSRSWVFYNTGRTWMFKYSGIWQEASVAARKDFIRVFKTHFGVIHGEPG